MTNTIAYFANDVQKPRSLLILGNVSEVFASFPKYGVVEILEGSKLVKCLCDLFVTGLDIDFGKHVKGLQIY